MNNIAITNNRILPSSEKAIDTVRKLQDIIAAEAALVEIDTHHVIHGGMYSRTIKIPAGTIIAGALLKVATILIVQGDVLVYTGDNAVELHGYNVFAASARRKQAFFAINDTYLTTVFPTKASTVENAEEEFTDEADMLLSRKHMRNNTITITGE